MRIHRELRSARTSALTTEERHQALRAAEKSEPKGDRPTPGTGEARGATPGSRAGSP
ncbi:MAG TPA: hypothetical protein VFZ86_10090 [Thermoleophilia bacterium]|nr:hypothetical protein [Thermoleophilia bacterium]